MLCPFIATVRRLGCLRPIIAVEQTGEGTASFTVPDFMECRNDAKTPMQGPAVEVSGVSWRIETWNEGSQVDGFDLVCLYLDATFSDVRRVWVDAKFSFVKPDGSSEYVRITAKELFGSSTLPRRSGFAIAKVICGLLSSTNDYLSSRSYRSTSTRAGL